MNKLKALRIIENTVKFNGGYCVGVTELHNTYEVDFEINNIQCLIRVKFLEHKVMVTLGGLENVSNIHDSFELLEKARLYKALGTIIYTLTERLNA